MKLITLISTFIITLASSNVFAQTFVCENWTSEKEEFQGTMFSGEKNNDSFTIRDSLKKEKFLTFLGFNTVFFRNYIAKNSNETISIFTITNRVKVCCPEFLYDFSIVELQSWGNLETNCNFQ